MEAAIDLGIESLTVYAFSTENWLRPPPEVDSLMEIFRETIDRELPDLAAQGVRTRFIGRRDRAPESLQERMAALEFETASRDVLQLWIAFDYGGRAELADAARAMIAAGLRAEEIDEDVFAVYLYAPDMADPDLVIRTSGSCGCPTSSSGNWRTRSSSSWTRSGRTSARRNCERPWPPLQDGSGGSAGDERVLVAHPDLGGGDPARPVADVPRWLAAVQAPIAATLIALHELYWMTRTLRPVVLAGYLGAIATLLGAERAARTGALAGVFATLALAFVFPRARPRRRVSA